MPAEPTAPCPLLDIDGCRIDELQRTPTGTLLDGITAHLATVHNLTVSSARSLYPERMKVIP